MLGFLVDNILVSEASGTVQLEVGVLDGQVLGEALLMLDARGNAGDNATGAHDS